MDDRSREAIEASGAGNWISRLSIKIQENASVMPEFYSRFY